ncbi:hypothetical protein [Magnetofaba australis]|uniref:C1q domain-containing protein n=1 Tax=Magnetofaba australis IT-1 TaxID=1434232 RepID=A0A1Y2K8A6_9PROT|nr:hypothetical protein [Magnetofaba australis]OSM06981.1 hypothetical protein MAIT1_00121 [Magnetofaba australis IT-1]
MAFNGSGLFNRLYSWTQDAANNVKISASRMDAEMDGFATGLTSCITKNGESTTTSRIPFAEGITIPSNKGVHDENGDDILTQPKFCAIWNATTSAVTGDGSWHTLAPGVTLYNDGGGWSGGVYTIPQDGVYRFIGSLNLTGVSAATHTICQVEAVVNGATYYWLFRQNLGQILPGGSASLCIDFQHESDFTQGDTVSFRVIVGETGKSVCVEGATAGTRSRLTATRLP